MWTGILGTVSLVFVASSLTDWRSKGWHKTTKRRLDFEKTDWANRWIGCSPFWMGVVGTSLLYGTGCVQGVQLGWGRSGQVSGLCECVFPWWTSPRPGGLPSVPLPGHYPPCQLWVIDGTGWQWRFPSLHGGHEYHTAGRGLFGIEWVRIVHVWKLRFGTIRSLWARWRDCTV